MEFNGNAGYGTVCPVVWEDGGGDPASYPIALKLSIQTGNHRRSIHLHVMPYFFRNRHFARGLAPINQRGKQDPIPGAGSRFALRIARAGHEALIPTSEVEGERTLGCGFPRPRGKHRTH